MVNYYEILEVSEKASKEVIEKAYKALAKKYHPDLNQDNKKEAEQKMKQLNEAYEVLISDEKRANYDSILEKKRELERRKASRQSSSQSNTNSKSSSTSSSTNQSSDDIEKQFSNYNTISYSNGYYTDNEGNFYVNTSGMDEKTKKKLKEKLQERYLEAYDAYLRERGYKLKYKWTFKRIFQLILTIIVIIIVFTILFFIPPIHNMCIELYEENIVVRLLVNLVRSIFTSIFSIFS